jgi:hypothetical protein
MVLVDTSTIKQTDMPLTNAPTTPVAFTVDQPKSPSFRPFKNRTGRLKMFQQTVNFTE